MRWVQNVHTVATFPPKDTFNQSAEKIAKVLADPKVSPKGLGSAIRMVQYFINRAGKTLSARRRQTLEKAKRLLQERREKESAKSPQKERAKRPMKRSKTSPRSATATRRRKPQRRRKRGEAS